MKQINKNIEPQSFVRHRANRPAYYSGLSLSAKEDLRGSLLLEQGYICCYCMKRIPEKIEINGRISNEMKVEHFQSQDAFPAFQLTYSNLFGACTGNEGKPKKIQTCDTCKGNKELMINILSTAPNCESFFKYNSEGEISSIRDNEEVNAQLNEVLNLNMQTLKDSRSQIYTEVQEKVRNESKKFKNDKAGFTRFLEQEKNKWLSKTENKYKPYCMVAVYYLTKKIKNNSK